MTILLFAKDGLHLRQMWPHLRKMAHIFGRCRLSDAPLPSAPSLLLPAWYGLTSCAATHGSPIKHSSDTPTAPPPTELCRRTTRFVQQHVRSYAKRPHGSTLLRRPWPSRVPMSSLMVSIDSVPLCRCSGTKMAHETWCVLERSCGAGDNLPAGGLLRRPFRRLVERERAKRRARARVEM